MDAGLVDRLFGELPLGLAILGAIACLILGVILHRITQGFETLTAEAKAGRAAVYEARDELRDRILEAEKSNADAHLEMSKVLERIAERTLPRGTQ